MASSPPRADVVLAAVHFLADPAVASSPLAARIAFLENKGLTQPEIKQAMASYSPTANSSTSQAMPTSQLMLLSQTQNQPTWRDHAFMAGLVVACGYGLWQLIQVLRSLATSLAHLRLTRSSEIPSSADSNRSGRLTIQTHRVNLKRKFNPRHCPQGNHRRPLRHRLPQLNHQCHDSGHGQTDQRNARVSGK